jgi:hypothetical protein
MATDPGLTRNWLKMVGAYNIGAMTGEEIEWRLSVLAPALAAEFDPEVFTPETARTVARQTQYFPTFGEICKALEPLLQQCRESRRILALPPPRYESREPYRPPPAPEWCFERKPRLLGRRDREEIADLAQPPARTVAQQYAELTGCSLAEAEAALRRTPVDA